MTDLAFDEFNLPTCSECARHWYDDKPLTGARIFAYFSDFHEGGH